MGISVVGIVGAGVMGRGLAQNLAQTGHKAIMVDVNDAILTDAMREIRQNLRFHRMFTGQALEEPVDTIMDRITVTTDYEALAESDYLVENTTEKWEVKAPIYPKIDAICRESTVFAVNTSCFSITRVGALTNRPDRVVGIHFMNPVPLRPAVEVIRGWHTSEETLETTRQMLSQMGKEWTIVNDSPGFVSNRVLMLTVNEAIYVVQEGIATAEEVDRIFTTCFGHATGPLATADLIGLDTILYSVEVLYESFNDSKYRPCPLLKKMVDAGLLGRKSGQGFYTYN